MKVLILTKRGSSYGGYHQGTRSGLYYSCQYVVDMLNHQDGIHAKLVDVVDNNDIDREVHEYRPDVVILEALWVVPEKFDVLKRLHPHVTWIVRIHSELPFLTYEGVAMDWITGYLAHGVYVAFNSERTAQDTRCRYAGEPEKAARILWLPNYYPTVGHRFGKHGCGVAGHLWVGCFGAIRPMKNQLAQAYAAITLAEERGDQLRFVINASRVETNGAPVLKNIRGLFADAGPQFKLMELPWLDRPEFLDFCTKMDLGMQVSMSESYNLVAANLIGMGVPVVTSHAVRFVHPYFQADPGNVRDMVTKAKRALAFGFLNWNARRLNATSRKAVRQWDRVLHDLAG